MQNEIALSYHRVRGLHLLAVYIVLLEKDKCNSLVMREIWTVDYFNKDKKRLRF